MSQPTTTDFTAPFDPTGYLAITGAQLLQFLQGLFPNTDQGIVLTTDDVATVPQVPDANTNTKWQRYIWLRIGATSVGMYVWNPGGAADPTFLNWQPAFQAAIPAASIQGYQIAPNTITDINIASLSYSKITGAPTGITPTGPAGGSLTGTYPNPSIGAQQVTTAMIALVNITNALIADGTIDIQNKILVNGVWTAKQLIRVNDGATGLIGETKLITQFAEPTITEANKVVAVNGAGTAFVYATPTAIGRILQIVESIDNTAGTDNAVCSLTTLPTTGNTNPVAALDTTITPISAASTLLVEASLVLAPNSAEGVVALFQDAGGNAIAATCEDADGSGKPVRVTLAYKVASGSTTARTFKVGFAGVSASNTRYNSTDGATKLFGGTLGVNSYLKVTEYL